MKQRHLRLDIVLLVSSLFAAVGCSSAGDTGAPPGALAGTGGTPGSFTTGGGPGGGSGGSGQLPPVGGFSQGAGGGQLGSGGGTPYGGAPPVGGAGPSGGAPQGGTSSGGAAQGGDAPIGGSGAVDPVGNANRAPGFVDLTPPLGAPLPEQGAALDPAPPAGWQWHPIDGAICRDGSPTGVFVYRGTSNNLVFFLEGGGACSNVGFCRFNPKNANEILAGDGSSVIGSAGGAIAGRQQPGGYSAGVPGGVFDATNAANPFKDWSKVYVPYCTGDVHAGTKRDATVPGTPGADARDIPKHQFVGYYNMQKIVGRVVPTFGSVSSVLLTGSSAGAFGAEVNFSMIQDAFGNVPVTVLGDSGVPFSDDFMPVCMQKKWRETWGIAFPPDCTECQRADGGGMLGMADFLMRKHPKAKIGLISSMEDEVIRLFFSVGLQTCANYDTADPVGVTLGQLDPNTYMPAAQYTGGLNALRTQYQATGKLATFYLPGQVHQHVFRPEFLTATAGGLAMTKFATDFMAGTVANVGP